jgi:hypothetical protein
VKRFKAFTDEQAQQLAKALNDYWKNVSLVVSLLFVGVVLGFGYGLKVVSDSSHDADAALRAANQVIRDRATDARRLAAANQKNAIESAKTAYAACRRQQESTQAARIGAKALLADPDPNAHHLAIRYYRFLNAQHLLDVPICPKPPAEGD